MPGSRASAMASMDKTKEVTRLHSAEASRVAKIMGLAAVLQLGNLGTHETAHFGFDFVEQMAREVKTDCGFFLHQLLAHTPGRCFDKVRLLGAGAVAIFPHQVKQTALVGIGNLRIGKLKCTVNGGHQRSTVVVQSIKHRL